ncbi:MAG: gamma-glutamyltransferase, partial [Candidatus Limnocylindria bacterium]
MPARSEWLISKSEAVAERGMVTADQPAAAEAGLAVLREGGNAVDAAVTAAFVMAVAEPFTSGVGGVACLVARFDGGRAIVVDG